MSKPELDDERPIRSAESPPQPPREPLSPETFDPAVWERFQGDTGPRSSADLDLWSAYRWFVWTQAARGRELPPLSPESTRLDAPGVPVVLSDGREWFFASPGLRMAPKFEVAGGSVVTTMAASIDYPASVKRHLERLRDEESRGPEHVSAEAVYQAAFGLLTHCHELRPAEAADLLACGPEGFIAVADGIRRAVRSGFESDPAPSEEADES